MDPIRSWIALDLLEGIGPKTAQGLLEVFGSPQAVLRAKEADLTRLGFLRRSQIASLIRGADANRIDEILMSLEKIGARAICPEDTSYPASLREIEAKPLVLYIKGSIDDLNPAVAIVGTRSPSHYGTQMARSLARDLSTMGVSVISGLARGIDKEAHLGALEGVSKTVAVMGSGIDVVYPPEHGELSGAICRRGALVSEFAPGTKPDAKNFPRRNRIISGLALATIVVEATVESGAMITARFALEQNRLVMAVPGNATNIRSRGPHNLLRQGAVLVETARDVIAEISPAIEAAVSRLKEKNSPTDDILTMASGSPVTIDEIAGFLGIDVIEAARRVSELELTGAIRRVSPNRYIARDIHG